MKTHPLQDFVLVRPLVGEHRTPDEFFISGSPANSGAVIAASAGMKLNDGNWRPLNVKVGDKVLFGKLIGQPVKIDDEELLLMRGDEIAAVVDV